ncbi:hypothetical protein [Mycetohabitans sp. B46]
MRALIERQLYHPAFVLPMISLRSPSTRFFEWWWQKHGFIHG